MATFGIGANWRRPVWAAVVVAELALGALVAAGSNAGAYSSAALLGGFALLLGAALAHGRGGLPCGCLGRKSRVSAVALARNLVAAGLAAALPSIGGIALSDVAWLQIGLALVLVAVLALGAAVAALAREVGELRLRVGPETALDVAGEGPAVGSRVDLAEAFAQSPVTRYLVAVFSSEGCPLCSALEPSVDLLSSDSLLAVSVFDEFRDAAVWTELNVPGSPYGVVLDGSGVVLAKGTFNSLGQLQGLIAGAASRQSVTAVHA